MEVHSFSETIIKDSIIAINVNGTIQYERCKFTSIIQSQAVGLRYVVENKVDHCRAIQIGTPDVGSRVDEVGPKQISGTVMWNPQVYNVLAVLFILM